MTKLCKDCAHCRPEMEKRHMGSLWWARTIEVPKYRFAKCAAPEANPDRADHLVAGEVYEPEGYCVTKRKDFGEEKQLSCGAEARWFVSASPLPQPSEGPK